MKYLIRAILIALMTFTGSVCAASPEDHLEQLASAMEGNWDSHMGTTDLAIQERFVDRRIRIRAPEIGKYVFYQQLNQDENLKLYRQRILVLSISENGRLIQRAHALRNPQKYVNSPASGFDELKPDDLKPRMAEGCEQVWKVTETGFRGWVDPAKCVVMSLRTGKPRGIESINILSGNELRLVERGFDEQGQQVFGTPQGESLLLYRAQ